MVDKAGDQPFHFEIWRGPSDNFGDEPKAIYYVENHNAECGYAELALDFQIAAERLLHIYEEEQFGNWMAPTAHLICQTLELKLKALLEAISDRDPEVGKKIFGGHNLAKLWNTALKWLDANGFKATQDLRLAQTSHLIAAFHAIDPTGDLFRFGISYQTAYEKRKSYDRVGIDLETAKVEFEAATGFLDH